MKPDILRKLHLTEQEVLDEIVRVCEKNNLRYYLVGGTLLGAIRHKGFIPWDDDLDIGMPRHDYMKFCELAPKELGQGYYLHDYHNDNNYWLAFGKIQKKNTAFVTTSKLYDEAHSGIWVDIFPLDEECSSKKNNVEKKCRLLSKLKTLSYRKAAGFSSRNLSVLLQSLMLLFIKLEWLIKLQNYIMTRSMNNFDNDYFMNYGSKYGIKKQFLPKSYYEPSTKVEFENKLYSAPGEYIKVLESIYGKNYMQLPPKDKQVTHNPIRLSFDLNGEDEKL